jgi:hypothetical protein
MKNLFKKNGYVALITLIIIGAIVLTAVLSLTFISLSQRAGMIERDRTLKNYYLANACAHEALIRLQKDLSYSGNETIIIDNYSCRIEAILGSGNNSRTIITRSQIAEQQKKIKIDIAQLRPVTIINSWGETY